jgi:hypothetical protein
MAHRSWKEYVASLKKPRQPRERAGVAVVRATGDLLPVPPGMDRVIDDAPAGDPISLEGRAEIAWVRVAEAIANMRKNPGDRAYEVALYARYDELVAIGRAVRRRNRRALAPRADRADAE